MDLFEAIKERHSYRGAYKDEGIPEEHLRKIVDAGLKAPSGKNMQTTRFVIVNDPDILKKIGDMEGARKAVQQAKAIILSVIDKHPEKVYEGMSFEVEDCAAAVENMLLAITGLGYGSVWIDGWLRVKNRAEQIGELVGLPEEKIVRVLLPVGVPAEEAERKEKMPFEQRAFFNKYGA